MENTHREHPSGSLSKCLPKLALLLLHVLFKRQADRQEVPIGYFIPKSAIATLDQAEVSR